MTFTFLTQVRAAGTVRSAENPELYLRLLHTELLLRFSVNATSKNPRKVMVYCVITKYSNPIQLQFQPVSHQELETHPGHAHHSLILQTYMHVFFRL